MKKKPTVPRRGGLNASQEDIQWLRLLDLKTSEGVPTFAVSRLVALGLVELQAGQPVITEKGHRLLSG
jgi:hypothetical protein